MPSPIRPLSLSKGGIWKQTGTEGDLYVKIKDRDGIDVSTSQGTPKTASKQPEGRGEVWNRFFLPALEGINIVNTLILNL